MLENIDLLKETSKAEYKKLMPKLELQLAELQRKARDFKIPVIVVFEGWDAAGKGTLINKLIGCLDPRGFNVYPINAPTEDERLRPFLWRFWIRTPASGRIAVFDRSWYGRVLVERVEKVIRKKDLLPSYDQINAFERQLSDDGAVIIKFFLHISKDEQDKRFRALQKNRATSWKVTKDDWRRHRQYHKYADAVEDMLARTDRPNAPWTIVEAHDNRYAAVKSFTTVIRAIEDRIESLSKPARPTAATAQRPPPQRMAESTLRNIDMSPAISREEYEDELKKLQKRVWEVEHQIYTRRIPVMILYEGWDAAGKGGNIKRITRSMDPRGYEVVSIAAPNDVEKSHHYLWRFWNHIPKAGHLTIFDRTWYGRVLVERIERFCTETEWKRAYTEINEIEEQMTSFGAVLVKFWLHISKEEQLARFKVRQKNPHKQWKIGDEDWRNREKWNAYLEAVDDMLIHTSTAHAPWTVIEANDKLYARIKALKTVIHAIEAKL